MKCPRCRKDVTDWASFCEYCGAPLRREEEPVSAVQKAKALHIGVEAKHENVLTGLVGALLGAALGGASIVLLSQIDLVASISGLILAVCTLKGYELLGGCLSKKGIAICVALMLLTPYLADRIDWAIIIMRELGGYGLTFGQAFEVLPALVEDGLIEGSTYYGNLALIYFFVLLGAFSTVYGQVKQKRNTAR